MRLLPLLFAGLIAFASGAAQQKQLRRAPGFSLPDLQQRQIDLGDYRGRWVLLDFMKTDCPHCSTLSPVLEQAARRHGARVAVISILVPPDTPAKASQYAQEYKVSSPFVFDCGQVMYSYVLPSPANPAVEFPHLYVINPEGFIVRDLVRDAIRPEKLAAELDSLIGAPRRR